MKLTCIAIDDEARALDLIQLYCKKIPFLDLQECFRDAIKALNHLQHHKLDLIFLDINMPDINGIQFLEALEKAPMVVFTTAYSEYAVKSYDYHAIDYLLKPITISRFLKAATRALEQRKLSGANSKIASEDIANKHILIKSGQETHQVFLDDILFVEGAQNYVFIHTRNKKIISLLRMTDMEEMLPSHSFIRIHKSYIVSLQNIETIESHRLHLGQNIIPIGKTYREHFRKQIQKGID